jgi:two-component system chemotaxis response regulator CheY
LQGAEHNVKILIADDDPGSRRLLSVSLAYGGHEVVVAEDGARAWHLFQQEPTRLVITDWVMPNLDGTGLISRIRAAAALQGYTYIILLTALGDKPNVVTGLEAGADDYLTKPFDADELLARVAIGERIITLEENLNASRRKAETMAMQDTLTGILNRRAIQDRAAAELSRLKRGQVRPSLSVIMLDLDHFKQVNDAYGHAAGDAVLRQVAERLTQQLRAYDWVGRWGGEEFLIVLPGTGLPEARAAAERLRECLAAMPATMADGRTIALSASLGVASLSAAEADDIPLDAIVRSADRALYRAKSQGRNQVCLAEAD